MKSKIAAIGLLALLVIMPLGLAARPMPEDITPDWSGIKTVNRICKGDVNLDKRRNVFDIGPWMKIYNYGRTATQANGDVIDIRSDLSYWAADADNNGIVNDNDLPVFVDILTKKVKPVCRNF